MKPGRLIYGKQGLLFSGAVVSLLLLLIYLILPTTGSSTPDRFGREASSIMRESLDLISLYCSENNINRDRINDPALSGLIGSEMSGITTTIGHLEAKRTTLNPQFASLITELLQEAGVKSGDTIAIGSSGSFPALMIASLAAAEAMHLYPVVIISLGSSSYGANNPDFTLLDIYLLLLQKGLISSAPAAVSLGGEYDRGVGFEDDMLERMKQKIKESGYTFIFEDDLKSNVSRREEIYSIEGTAKVSAFINTGGSYANMGTDALSLKIPPGLVGEVKIPDQESRGVIFSMLSKKIPVIHLLYIKGLTQRYNMEWDPLISGSERKLSTRRERSDIPVFITGSFAVILFALFLFRYSKLNN